MIKPMEPFRGNLFQCSGNWPTWKRHLYGIKAYFVKDCSSKFSSYIRVPLVKNSLEVVQDPQDLPKSMQLGSIFFTSGVSLQSIRSDDSLLSRHAHFFNWGIPEDSTDLPPETPLMMILLGGATFSIPQISVLTMLYDVWSAVDCCPRSQYDGAIVRSYNANQLLRTQYKLNLGRKTKPKLLKRPKVFIAYFWSSKCFLWVFLKKKWGKLQFLILPSLCPLLNSPLFVFCPRNALIISYICPPLTIQNALFLFCPFLMQCPVLYFF